MNQKNIFTAIAVVLVLQGLAFYFMGGTIGAESFPDLNEACRMPVTVLMTVIGVLSILVGLISYAARNSPSVLWAYVLGAGLLLCNTSKHRFIDHLNVPIPAMVIQLAIVLACGWLWMQNRSSSSSS